MLLVGIPNEALLASNMLLYYIPSLGTWPQDAALMNSKYMNLSSVFLSRLFLMPNSRSLHNKLSNFNDFLSGTWIFVQF
jgi:hypothetical protein